MNKLFLYTPALPALALALTIAVCYYPATEAGFVWDDSVMTKAWVLKEWSGIRSIWFDPRAIQKEGHYWPVLYSTFWLEYQLWKLAPAGYHIVNLVMHCTATLLLWRLLLRLGLPGAYLAALVFAVHPLHVESVAWVIGRKDVLATIFYLGAALAYIRFVERGRRRDYAAAFGLFILGMLSKSIAVTLPAAMLLWHWWRQPQRHRKGGKRRQSRRHRKGGKTAQAQPIVTQAEALRMLPFWVTGLGITLADWYYYRSIDPVDFDYSLLERALLAARILWFYVGKLMWPADLAVIYPKWEMGLGALGWVFLSAAVVAVGLLWRYQRQLGRGPLCGVLFYIISLSPVLGFIDFGFMKFSFVADRYQYLAGAGIIALVVGAGAHGFNKLPASRRQRRIVQAAVLMPLCMLGVLCWQQASIYHNPMTFYQHVVSLNTKARFAHLMLGFEYGKLQRYQEALKQYQMEYDHAMAERPKNHYHIGQARLGLGTIAERNGDFETAEAHYRYHLANPAHLHRLTAMWLRQGRYQEVADLSQEFLHTNPHSAALHFDMGQALAGLKRFEEAWRSYQRALEFDPRLSKARRALARLQEALNRGGAADSDGG